MKRLEIISMKRLMSIFLCGLLLLSPLSMAQAATTAVVKKTQQSFKQDVKIAFVFDGPSNANTYFLKNFKTSIQKSMDSDTLANFPSNLVFVGDWTDKGAKAASDRALYSNADVVVSLGYLSSKYFSNLKNKKKFVITIDQYGLRDLGDGFFSPSAQIVQKIELFKRLTNFNKIAILMNSNYYNTRKDWKTHFEKKFAGKNINFVVVPVNTNVEASVSKIASDVDAAFVLPMLNLNLEQLKGLFTILNNKKIKTFSALGESDVQLGCMLGSGALDLDRKITEATSFNIRSVLDGAKYKSEKLYFYEDEILYINTDTAETVGYEPHIRLLSNAKIISHKPVPKFTLTEVFNKLSEQNLDIEQKSYLVKAANKAALSARLRYLPTFTVNLGYQQYNHDYAESAALLIPEKTGVFGMSLEQVIYSPALVTNILVKNRKVDFTKSEYKLAEQNMGIDLALLYIDTLILENAIKTQEEIVKDSRENLAMARVREKTGYAGKEEALRWASQLNMTEQKLISMTADYKNLKLMISKVLAEPQNKNFDLALLTAHDPAFYTSELNILDYVRTPQALEKFTQLLVDEAYEVSPELEKLRAAIKMKDHEKSMYVQKFFLPDAKVAFDYQNLTGREYGKDTIKLLGAPVGLSALHSDAAYARVGVYAQWRPLEGGTKFAEIARINAERKQLQVYSDEVRHSLEEHIRSVVNKALACYFCIEKEYKAMFTAKENYETVKVAYLRGKAPITQVIDAQDAYFQAKIKAVNSQNEFFKQLVWVQRGICSVNWSQATPRAKDWIKKVKTDLPAMEDIRL